MSETAFDERRRKDMVDARLLRRSFDSEVGANEIEDGEKRVSNARLSINLRVGKPLGRLNLRNELSAFPAPVFVPTRNDGAAEPVFANFDANRARLLQNRSRDRFARQVAEAAGPSELSRQKLFDSILRVENFDFPVVVRDLERRLNSKNASTPRRQETSPRRRVRPTSNDFNLVATFGGVRRRSVKRAASELKNLRQSCRRRRAFPFSLAFSPLPLWALNPRTLARRFPRREARRRRFYPRCRSNSISALPLVANVFAQLRLNCFLRRKQTDDANDVRRAFFFFASRFARL